MHFGKVYQVVQTSDRKLQHDSRKNIVYDKRQCTRRALETKIMHVKWKPCEEMEALVSFSLEYSVSCDKAQGIKQKSKTYTPFKQIKKFTYERCQIWVVHLDSVSCVVTDRKAKCAIPCETKYEKCCFLCQLGRRLRGLAPAVNFSNSLIFLEWCMWPVASVEWLLLVAQYSFSGEFGTGCSFYNVL